ncbi:hypothetical protein CAAN1_11S01420 [[Candida] anglica]|uniref:Serine aminopeptidase S33 domain-containing protein n=1 Tax=[Candida] anglica TaxID=148631 RepID=A0ABP0EJF9_9ASCO
MTAWIESEKAQIDSLIGFAAHGWKTPVLKTPDTVGLAYEDVFFPSLDGVSIEGWFIPGKSNRLIICNHFWPGNRYGFAGQLEGLQGFGGFEVNFLNYYKQLHDAGYNILTYDFRNHGLSGDGNGKTFGLGLFEYRDVIGSINYANSRPDTKKMDKALMSICLGCNSTIIGYNKHPEIFKDIKCMLGLQPVSARPFLGKVIEHMGLKKPLPEIMDYVDEKLVLNTGFHLDDLTPVPFGPKFDLPAKIFQLKTDFRTDPSDVQAIYDSLGSKDKELHWFDFSTERFTAYNYFGEHPELMLEWFDKHF